MIKSFYKNYGKFSSGTSCPLFLTHAGKRCLKFNCEIYFKRQYKGEKCKWDYNFNVVKAAI